MFENILQEFKKLTVAINFLSEANAKELIDFVSRTIMEELGAYTIDLLWKQRAERGIFLNVLWSKSNSNRGQAKGHFVNEESHGIWSKVYREKKPVWIEGIQSKQCIKSIQDGGEDNTLGAGYIRLTEPVKNKRGGDIVEIDDLVFYEDTDTVIAIPMSYRDIIWGVYSIELQRYQKSVEDKTFREIYALANAMASVIWKSDVEKQYLKDTSRAINNFKDSIATFPVSIRLNPVRVGFLIRPFVGEEFEYIEKYINKSLHKKNVHVSHYSHPAGGGIVIQNLMEEIKKAHFGIADITKNRPNSLLELGMMMILNKKFIILKRKDDDTDVPFDIGAYQYYKYEMKGPELVFFEPGKDNPLKIDDVFNSFIKILERDRGFSEAQPYTAGYGDDANP